MDVIRSVFAGIGVVSVAVIFAILIVGFKEWFKEKILLDFEGYKFWCPKDYDKILNFCFGDYMKLPPENKRIHHSIEAYWKDTK